MFHQPIPYRYGFDVTWQYISTRRELLTFIFSKNKSKSGFTYISKRKESKRENFLRCERKPQRVNRNRIQIRYRDPLYFSHNIRYHARCRDAIALSHDTYDLLSFPTTSGTPLTITISTSMSPTTPVTTSPLTNTPLTLSMSPMTPVISSPSPLHP